MDKYRGNINILERKRERRKKKERKKEGYLLVLVNFTRQEGDISSI